MLGAGAILGAILALFGLFSNAGRDKAKLEQLESDAIVDKEVDVAIDLANGAADRVRDESKSGGLRNDDGYRRD